MTEYEADRAVLADPGDAESAGVGSDGLVVGLQALLGQPAAEVVQTFDVLVTDELGHDPPSGDPLGLVGIGIVHVAGEVGRPQPRPRASCFSAVSTLTAEATTMLRSGSSSRRWNWTT